MRCQLNWKRETSISVCHALAALNDGREFVDPTLKRALETQIAKLQAKSLPPSFYQHLVPLSGGQLGHTELARVAGRKSMGSGPHAQIVQRGIDDILTTAHELFRAVINDLEKELKLRTGPIRQQWEARGPGLLHRIAQLTQQDLIVETADVFPIYPVCGGGGEAHLAYNSISIEAVLANPIDRLPETLRLGWLLSQLNLDRPAFADMIHGRRLPAVARLAMLPPTLTAAETVELGSYSLENISHALKSWRMDEDLTEPLDEWWKAYQVNRPVWHIAMAGLDRMMPQSLAAQTPVVNHY